MMVSWHNWKLKLKWYWFSVWCWWSKWKDAFGSQCDFPCWSTEDPGRYKSGAAAPQDIADLLHLLQVQHHHPEDRAWSKLQLSVLQVCWMQKQNKSKVLFCICFLLFVCRFRSGTILHGKKIEMRSFLFIAYFFVATFLTHEQLIHEIDLTCESGTFQLSTGSKTSNQTVVFYNMIFRYIGFNLFHKVHVLFSGT